jgi:hypothetical protein
MPTMRAASRFLASLAPCLAFALVGCGGSTDGKPLDMGGEDGNKISALIEEVNEGIGSAREADALFAKGSKPADLKKFTKFTYSIVGKPSVTGSTGTAKVRIDPAGGGQSLGEKEWTFEKDGDKWKIKTAQFP